MVPSLIIPGFINSHTHSDLTISADRSTPKVFSDWVLSLTEKRRKPAADEKNGIRKHAYLEFVKSGTVLIGDILQPDSFPVHKEKIRIKGFIEVRGIDPAAADGKIALFKQLFSKAKEGPFFSPGISPHSVDSVSENLFRKILDENCRLGLKTAIHASEHKSEIEYISGSGGDISKNLLPALGLSRFSLPPKTYRTPVSCLYNIGMLGKETILVHANEINDEDIEIIKQTGVSIVHCPRSNSFFSSARLPLKRLLDEGVNVALGTDSLYSNESVSIIDEIKYARKIHPGVSSRELFDMATVNGASALSFPGVTGRLEEGSFADFIALRINPDINLNPDNVYDMILDAGPEDIMFVVIHGNIVYNNPLI